MKNLQELMGTTPRQDEKSAPHERAACVNEIDKLGLVTGKYDYTYWLGKVKRVKVDFAEMLEILKEIQKLPAPYSKGGRLTNVLTELAKKRK